MARERWKEGHEATYWKGRLTAFETAARATRALNDVLMRIVTRHDASDPSTGNLKELVERAGEGFGTVMRLRG